MERVSYNVTLKHSLAFSKHCLYFAITAAPFLFWAYLDSMKKVEHIGEKVS
jgi:hypothetical protein